MVLNKTLWARENHHPKHQYVIFVAEDVAKTRWVHQVSKNKDQQNNEPKKNKHQVEINSRRIYDIIIKQYNVLIYFTLKLKRSRGYLAETVSDADYADDLALLANSPAQAKSLEHSLKQAAIGAGLYLNSDKTKFMYFNQDCAIFSINIKHWN